MDRFLKRKQTTDNEQTEGTHTSQSQQTCDEVGQAKKKKQRMFKFSENWKTGRPWLSYDEGKMYCIYCKEYEHASTSKRKNAFVTGCDSLRLENVHSHEDSHDHKLGHTAYLNVRKQMAERPIVKAIINLEKHDMHLMQRLFNTAFFIAKHEKPFSELQNKNYPGEASRITEHYNSDKQASTFIHFIAKAHMEKKLQKIQEAEFIAVALDGSTDCANLEQESFFVSYLDSDFQPHTDFIKLTSVKSRATAQGLKDCFFEVFNDLGIDVKSCCVQLATDGPSVMKNMVNLVKNEIGSWVLQFHCANHRLELAFKDAVKNVSLCNDVYDLLYGLYRFYGNSSLQWRMLTNTADLLGIKPLVHPTPKGTRWVAHRESAVLAVDRNFAALASQLQECNNDPTQKAETRAKALGLKEKLVDEDLVLFIFAIFKGLLAIFSSLSCLLQNDDVSIDTLMSTTRRAKEKLRQVHSGTKIKDFQEQHIDEHKVFRDVQLKKKRTAGRNASPDKVKTQGDSLVKELKTALTERLGDLGDGNIGTCPEIALFSVFDISKLPDCELDDLEEYGKAEVQGLTKHFYALLSAKGYDPDRIEDERVSLWEYVSSTLKSTTKKGRTIKTFWPKILRRKSDSADLRNILALVKILLVQILSTACVERGFSLMNRVKTDWRANLKTETLNELMLLQLSSCTVSEFDPDPAIKLWWLDAKKPRRLVDAYGSRTTTLCAPSESSSAQTET